MTTNQNSTINSNKKKPIYLFLGVFYGLLLFSSSLHSMRRELRHCFSSRAFVFVVRRACMHKIERMHARFLRSRWTGRDQVLLSLFFSLLRSTPRNRRGVERCLLICSISTRWYVCLFEGFALTSVFFWSSVCRDKHRSIQDGTRGKWWHIAKFVAKNKFSKIKIFFSLSLLVRSLSFSTVDYDINGLVSTFRSYQ